VATVLQKFRNDNELEEIKLFYLERLMDQLDSGCNYLARNTFFRYKSHFQSLLQPSHIDRLEQNTQQQNSWTRDDELKFLDRMNNAWLFGEHKTVHDCGQEIMLRQNDKTDVNVELVEQVQNLLASNNAYYIEPDNINVNTFINAKVAFVVGQRKSQSNPTKPLAGNPGFYLRDACGLRYRCFIKQVNNIQEGDEVKLKITNIPGLVFATLNTREPIIYLEPRTTPGETIEVEIGSISHTENSFTFRYHSYDGFLWFKRHGVNKRIFNKFTLRPGDRINARVLYTSEEEKRSSSGNITRLGIIKAIPLRRVVPASTLMVDQGNGVAKALN
jgi:hypothetical protein